MNYMINYASTPTGPVPVNSAGQCTIVLTPPSQSRNGNANSTTNNVQSTFPMMMQVGAANAPQVIYMYQNNDANDSTGSTGISQMMLAPVSPVQRGINLQVGNASSPSIPTMNVTTEKNPCVSRSLGEVFNVQTVGTVQNTGGIVQSSLQPSSHHTSDITSLLSTLQASGIHIIETTGANNGNNNSSIINLPIIKVNSPIINNQMQQSDIMASGDKAIVNNLINSLPASGVQVVENSGENKVMVNVPNRQFEDKSYVGENNIIPVSQSGCIPVEKMFKIVDRSGNIIVISAGVNETSDQQMQQLPGVPVQQGTNTDVSR